MHLTRALLSIPLIAVVAGLVCAATVSAQTDGTLAGRVRDSQQAAVSGARILLLSPDRTVVAATTSAADGAFSVRARRGGYELLVEAHGFAPVRRAVHIGAPRDSASDDPLDIELGLASLAEDVTVSAVRGDVVPIDRAGQRVTVVSGDDLVVGAKAVLAQAIATLPGVTLQRTSPTLGGVFVRGLTGNKVNVFIDGVRYSNAAQRGGVNTFFNLLEPSALDAIEVLRGPSSGEYGSDALGGSVQLLTRAPRVGAEPALSASVMVSASSADRGAGPQAFLSYGTRDLSLAVDLAGRRFGELRPGGGRDSHAAVTRFFGIPSDVLMDEHLPDTSFRQYGGSAKVNWAPVENTAVTAYYLRGQQDGGKRYDQLLGGDGNLVADLRNLMLDVGYARVERTAVRWLDRVTATYSYNTQREERVNQGGSGNPAATINHEYERTAVQGLQVSAGRTLTARHVLTIGGEYYHERIDAPSFGYSPTTGVTTVRRGRVPDNARYDSAGGWIQDVFDVSSRVRAIANLRVSHHLYEARAQDSPLVRGRILWPDEALSLTDVTGRGSVTVDAGAGWTISGSIGRGYRAPHITDLGTLGLTGAGFEVGAPDVAGLAGTVGSSAGQNAVSTGEPVEQLGPETSISYEATAAYRRGRVDASLTAFVNDIADNIQKQSLILPQGAVGILLGGSPIVRQLANGVVSVSEAPTSPVLVRANFDHARVYGFEPTVAVRVSPSVSIKGNFTYIHAEDTTLHRPPNIEGGTPAPQGLLAVRYAPVHGRYWVEPYVTGAFSQGRLSSLDLSDRRTGAARSADSIASFFNNGARARGWLSSRPGSCTVECQEDVLSVTGETLGQITERVLGSVLVPGGVPLYDEVKRYATINVRGGLRLTSSVDLLVDLENLTDENYRGISWGLDAPGRNATVFVRARF